jgi:hypothetical protein
MGQRWTWSEICTVGSYRGHWVALDACRYDQQDASVPVEGELVDHDENLPELCRRLRERSRSHCAILFCEEPAPPSSRAWRWGAGLLTRIRA